MCIRDSTYIEKEIDINEEIDKLRHAATRALFERRDVLIVEDIVDSGRTMSYLLRTLKARNPASLRVCTLLNKPGRRVVDVPLDYIGFDIPDEFVLGYGLDLDEKYRHLPFVCVLKDTESE